VNKLLLILFVFPLSIWGQEYYPLHPVIGDTLEAVEKKDYSLFPKVSNKNLDYCLIVVDSNKLKLNAFYTADTAKSFPLDHSEIVEAQQIIEKINAYYRTKDQPSSSYSESVVKKSKSKTSASPLIQQSQMSEKAQKEARMQLRIEADQKRLRDHERGLRPNNLHIEFR
jgi:hypothetical protein